MFAAAVRSVLQANLRDEVDVDERIEMDALALEYQRDYGRARGNLDVANLVNNPAANGVCRVFGLLLTEEARDLIGGQRGVLFDYRPYPTLVTQNSIELLA